MQSCKGNPESCPDRSNLIPSIAAFERMWLYIKTTQDKERMQSTLAVSATSMIALRTELYFNVYIPSLVKA